MAIGRILEPHVGEVVLGHAKDVRAISHARVKTEGSVSPTTLDRVLVTAAG
jgi:hypothetical protein